MTFKSLIPFLATLMLSMPAPLYAGPKGCQGIHCSENQRFISDKELGWRDHPMWAVAERHVAQSIMDTWAGPVVRGAGSVAGALLSDVRTRNALKAVGAVLGYIPQKIGEAYDTAFGSAPPDPSVYPLGSEEHYRADVGYTLHRMGRFASSELLLDLATGAVLGSAARFGRYADEVVAVAAKAARSPGLTFSKELTEDLAQAPSLRNLMLRGDLDLMERGVFEELGESVSRLEDLVTPGGRLDLSPVLKNHPGLDPNDVLLIYGMDRRGEIRVAVGVSRVVHHSSLFGINQRLLGAGTMTVRAGQISEIDRLSGHFMPPPGTSIPLVERVLRESNIPLSRRFVADDFLGLEYIY